MDGYKIIAERVVVTNPKGLDLRYTRMLVRMAGQFQAAVEVTYRGTVADGKSEADLLALGAPYGAVLELNIYGGDAPAAHRALYALFSAALARGPLPSTQDGEEE